MCIYKYICVTIDEKGGHLFERELRGSYGKVLKEDGKGRDVIKMQPQNQMKEKPRFFKNSLEGG